MIGSFHNITRVTLLYIFFFFFFLMIRRPPRSPLFPSPPPFRPRDVCARPGGLVLKQPRRGCRRWTPAALLNDVCQLVAEKAELRRRPRSVKGFRQDDVRADRKSTRLNSSHSQISYAVFCLKKKK